jgi:hypothetical protein
MSDLRSSVFNSAVPGKKIHSTHYATARYTRLVRLRHPETEAAAAANQVNARELIHGTPVTQMILCSVFGSDNSFLWKGISGEFRGHPQDVVSRAAFSALLFVVSANPGRRPAPQPWAFSSGPLGRFMTAATPRGETDETGFIGGDRRGLTRWSW